MRGKKKPDASSALAEALDILGFSAPDKSGDGGGRSDGENDE